MRFFSRALLGLAAAFALGACGEAGLTMYEPDPEDGVADVTLRAGVMPVLDQHACRGCHNATQLASNLDLDLEADPLWDVLMAGGLREAASYGQVVNDAVPAESLLLLAPLPDSSFAHTPKVFSGESDAGYRTILGWIENGALND